MRDEIQDLKASVEQYKKAYRLEKMEREKIEGSAPRNDASMNEVAQNLVQVQFELKRIEKTKQRYCIFFCSQDFLHILALTPISSTFR